MNARFFYFELSGVIIIQIKWISYLNSLFDLSKQSLQEDKPHKLINSELDWLLTPNLFQLIELQAPYIQALRIWGETHSLWRITEELFKYFTMAYLHFPSKPLTSPLQFRIFFWVLGRWSTNPNHFLVWFSVFNINNVHTHLNKPLKINWAFFFAFLLFLIWLKCLISNIWLWRKFLIKENEELGFDKYKEERKWEYSHEI